MVNNSAMKSTSHTNPEALWSHLHWLVVLGEQGSYTGAAARLGVSKAAMSQHIAELVLDRASGQMLERRTGSQGGSGGRKKSSPATCSPPR